MNGDDGFTSDDLAAAIMAGNEALMQWYALTHQTTLPVNPNTPIVTTPLPGGGRLNIPSNTIIVLGVVVILAIVLMK